MIFRWQLRVGEFSLSKGRSRGYSVPIEKHLIHPRYDGTTAYFDVAVILTKEIELSDTVQPICLPASANYSANVDENEGSLVQLAGKQ